MLLARKLDCFMVVLACLCLGSVKTAAQTAPILPLPSDITLQMREPGPDIAPDRAAFVGKWGGSLIIGTAVKRRAINVIVESVTEAGDASVVFIWDKFNDQPAGGRKLRGKIADGQLSWGNCTTGLCYQFKQTDEGKLAGERYDHGKKIAVVTMVRMP